MTRNPQSAVLDQRRGIRRARVKYIEIMAYYPGSLSLDAKCGLLDATRKEGEIPEKGRQRIVSKEDESLPALCSPRVDGFFRRRARGEKKWEEMHVRAGRAEKGSICREGSLTESVREPRTTGSLAGGKGGEEILKNNGRKMP